MVAKSITQSDLNALDLKISKEQTEYRHEDRKVLNNCVWEFEGMKTKLAVNDNILKNMTENFQEMKESFDKLVIKIEWLDDRYSGKWTEKVLVWLGSAIWLALIGALMTLILK